MTTSIYDDEDDPAFATDAQFWLMLVVFVAMLTLVAIGVGMSQRDAPPPFAPVVPAVTPTTYGPPPWP